MKLNMLTPAKGSVKKRTRLGRGQGSSKGKTCGRGHNGSQSRSGYTNPGYAQGGQMPLQRTSPKFGFKQHNRISYQVYNLDTLQDLAEKQKTTTIILKPKKTSSRPYKIVARGKNKLKLKLAVSARAFSASAKLAIEKLGGSTEILK